MTPPTVHLARFPWRNAIRRGTAIGFGLALATVGAVHLLRDFLGVPGQPRSSHSDWVPAVIIGIGALFVALGLDFENRVLSFVRGLPWPWGRSRKDESGTWVRIPRKPE